MGEAGNTEEEIRRQGRWSSQCYQLYTKRSRALNLKSQVMLMREINKKMAAAQ